jgi:CheY-like chemotaxis protein
MASIYIVDDHQDQCMPLMRLLQRVGHDTSCLASGPAALAMLDAGGRPDLIICDVMMPEMDGAEVLRRIRAGAATKMLPVIMYTAVNDEQYHDHLRDLGAVDVWLKARMEFGELMGRLDKHLPHGPVA